MSRRKYNPIPPAELLRKIKEAGIQEHNRMLSDLPTADGSDESLEPLSERVEHLLGIINEKERKETNMLFFVMYDIGSNKVRRLVSKYLLRQGCFRIQESVFLADISHEKYDLIRSDLAEVQAAYDNDDSILIVPISTDHLKSMKIIGQNINVDIITGTRNTLFF